MATVINNPNTDTSSSGMGAAMIILAIIVLGLIAYFAFGHAGSLTGGSTSTTQVNIPAGTGSGSAGTGGTSGGAAGGASGSTGAGY